MQFPKVLHDVVFSAVQTHYKNTEPGVLGVYRHSSKLFTRCLSALVKFHVLLEISYSPKYVYMPETFSYTTPYSQDKHMYI